MCCATRRLLGEVRRVRPAGELERFDHDFFYGVHEGPPLLLPATQVCWGEHSARATLSTWAAEIRIDKSERDYIGRWRPSESDEYVRNTILAVDRIQREVALHLKRTAGICESDRLTIEKVEALCLRRGVPSEEVTEMCTRIMCASRFCPIDTELVFEPEREVAVPATPSSDDGFGPPVCVSEPSDNETECLSKGLFAVNESKKTLHKIGSCWRTPGVHFRRLTILDPGEVRDPHQESHLFRHLCKDCFPKPAKAAEEDSSDSSNEASSSAESE
jgi:hypothetical protein